MREVEGNLWDYPADWRVIPTNGFVKRNGAAVMGRGLALQATERFPGLAYVLGKELLEQGNHVHLLPEFSLVTFPVKHNWWEDASLELIERSVKELKLLFVTGDMLSVSLPRVGCGNGRLSWDDVKPLLVGLDYRFTVVYPSED